MVQIQSKGGQYEYVSAQRNPNEDQHGENLGNVGGVEPVADSVTDHPLRRRSAGRLDIIGDAEDCFVLAVRGLKDCLDIPDGVKVVYPGSSTHVGVARVFGKDNVVHVDPAREACEALRESGYQAVQVGIEGYEPGERADLMVALNSDGAPSRPILKRVLKPGALIIANNYTEWAHELNAIDGVALVGAVLPAYSDPDSNYVAAQSMPKDATDVPLVTYHLKPGGQLVDHPEPGVISFTDPTPNYPDALFIFRLD